MDLWHARIFLHGEILDHDDFHGREAAQKWAEDRLRKMDPKIRIEWRNRGDIWEAGPSPDFRAQVLRKD